MMSNRNAKKMGMLIAAVLVSQMAVLAWGQDSPVSIKAYVFSMSVSAVENLVDNGISRAELDRLQGDLFEKGSLLSEATPIALQIGDNPITITGDSLAALRKNPNANVVVFFFEITRQDENLKAGKSIRYGCYASMDGEDPEKKINVRVGRWQLPAGAKKTRYMYYRNAVQLQYPGYVFELNIPHGSDEIQYALQLKIKE
ncbi:MAG: hypothetical protein C4527_02235 [Candidatus Omnitrophota bacterium]|jgi:hypothetical protein|nr:MAG: hypothetical protein C4527_02235 [Candidatus Omnitrophota bacterium]